MKEDYAKVSMMLDKEYTDAQCRNLVNCIMSENIGPDDVCKSLVGLGVNLNLSHELVEESEMDEDGELETFETSEFQNFVNESIESLLYNKDTMSWVKFYRKTLLQFEKYELLHILKLEKTWNI
jgi:hypothetical protein